MKKRFLSFILTFSLMFSVILWVGLQISSADDGTESDSTESVVLWEYEKYGEGVVLTKYNGNASDVYVPGTIEENGTFFKVLKLDDGLFENNDSLNSVTLAEGILEIGEKAFYDADNLVCIVTNEQLTAIGKNAFYGCDSFNSVILYDNVIAIGENAFAECSKLTVWCNEDTFAHAYVTENAVPFEIMNPNVTPEEYTVDGISYYVQNGEAIAIGCENTNAPEITIPSSVKGYPVTEIREVFKRNYNLKKITLNPGLKKIGEKAFWDCVMLEDAVIPEGVISIGKEAFFNCGSLLRIEIPTTVLTIGEKAFSQCTGLTDVRVLNGLTEIGVRSFASCSKLNKIELPDSLVSLGEYSFFDCDSLKNIIIPDSVETIGTSAFGACAGLETVKLSKNLTYLGENAFSSCVALTGIELPSSLGEVKELVFAGCSSLSTVTIPTSVTKISKDSFPTNTVLVVTEDSYSHTFAEKNDLLYFVSVDGSAPEVYDLNSVRYFIKDGEAIAIACTNKNITGVTIPATVKGYPVTALRETFKNCVDLESVVLSEGIECIGDNAFYDCTKLKQVSLPSTLLKINKYAFYHCVALKNITIPQKVVSIGEMAFYSTGINGIVIPSSVTSIGTSCFLECRALESITFSSGIKTIGNGAFMYCTNLKEIELPDTVSYLGNSAFYGCQKMTSAVLSNNIINIYNSTFEDCFLLESVSLPEKAEKIAYDVFAECSNLSYVIVPKTVKSLESSSFPEVCVLVVYEDSYAHTFAKNNDLLYHVYDGESLPSVVILNGIRYFITGNKAVAIGCEDKNITSVTLPEFVNGYPLTELRRTFAACSSLSDVVLNKNLTCIGDRAFYRCSSLKNITVPGTVTHIGNNAFYGCSSITSVELPDSVVSLGEYAFSDCDALLNVKMSDSLQSMGRYAFAYCDYLETVSLSEGLTVIPYDAFMYCFKLKEIQIPDGVVSINDRAFYYCSVLEKVILPDSVKTIGSNAFGGCSLLRHVYLSDELTYAAAKSFTSNSILLVTNDSYAHNYAVQNSKLYFVLKKANNPEVAYGAEISGKVTYSDGAVGGGIRVEIYHEDGTLKESVSTDENGVYSFTYAEVGKYTVRAVDEYGNTASTTVFSKRMNVFEVYVSGDTDLTLKKGWALSGRVEPATVAEIVISDESGNVIARTESADDGSFSFEGVSNGSYVITVETDSGMINREITVFNGDITDMVIEVTETTSSIYGNVEVESRDLKKESRSWVQVTLYNSAGIAVAQQKTDKSGEYSFEKLPLGEYVVVAECSEMRPERNGKGYDRSYILTGYAYVKIEEVGEYRADVVLYEKTESEATVSGKVTAHGETQNCEVILCDVFRHEIARQVTKKNGKFTFKNVNDGMYIITAVTESDGMGFAVIAVRDGEVYGNTNITVEKSDKIKNREDKFRDEVGNVDNASEAEQYRSRIAEEKKFYDSLSEKEKKQLSKEYVERLNRFIELLSSCKYTNGSNGVSVDHTGLVVSGEELECSDNITFEISVTEEEAWSVSGDGVNNDSDYIYQSIKDSAKDRELSKFFEITMTKTADGESKGITSVAKDTESTGKFRVTIVIPEEYRGHKHYSFVHVHHGETVMLTDLDDDPDTVTFEVDRFSTFALTYTDTDLISDSYDPVEAAGYEYDTVGEETVVVVSIPVGNDCISETELEAELNCDVTTANGFVGTGSTVSVGENIFKIIVKGDVDGDGSVNVFDAMMIKKALNNSWFENDALREYAGDFDDSGVTDSNDVSLMLSYIVGEITAF